MQTRGSNEIVLNDIAVHDSFDTAVPTALEGLNVENSVDFAGGRVEVRSYTWSKPVEDVWVLNTDICVINMALSPRPVPCRIMRVGPGLQSAPRDIGRILVIPPGSAIHVSAPTGRHRAMHCALHRHKIEEMLPRDLNWTDGSLERTMGLAGRRLEWFLLNIYRELRQERLGFGLMVESFANALCVELVRQFQSSQIEKVSAHQGGLAPWCMRIVRERVNADAPAPDLTELADLCCMTVRQLCRGFKQETGQTIGKFVESATLERARTLLSGSRLSVGEIARKLGFASSASFAYAFQRNTGLKPTEVRSRRQEGPHRRTKSGRSSKN